MAGLGVAVGNHSDLRSGKMAGWSCCADVVSPKVLEESEVFPGLIGVAVCVMH